MVIQALQYSLLLLGNANASCSFERQKLILRALNPKLQSFADKKSDDPNSSDLFGQRLRKDIRTHVELTKEVDAFERVTASHGRASKWSPHNNVQRGQFRGHTSRFMPYQSRGNYNRRPPFQRGTFTGRNSTGDQINHTILLAGRISFNLSEWTKLTQDSWVLNVVRGYQLPFRCKPSKFLHPAPHLIPKEQIPTVEQEIAKLFTKGAIEEVVSSEVFFLNQIFLVEKRDGGWRPIINLKPLNKYLVVEHFKMENITMLRNILEQGMWMVKIDLEDAYFVVPVSKDDRRYLQFEWKGKFYQFTCLPFGLATAPFVFTKLTRPVLQHLRFWGIKIIMYLDDLFLANEDSSVLSDELSYVRNLLQSLGFVINMKKSVFTPTRVIQYLGFEINTVSMHFCLPNEKKGKIIQVCKNLLQTNQTTPRKLAQFIGLITAANLACSTSFLHIRHLQQCLIEALRKNWSWDHPTEIRSKAQEEIRYWSDSISSMQGSPIHQKQPDLEIESDSSLVGWGSRCKSETTGGKWSTEDKSKHQHINVLELKAALLALQCFAKGLSGVHVRLRLDNKAAVSYVNHLGGTRSYQLNEVALELWDWCLLNNIWVSAEYLPGKRNLWADWESRNFQDSSDWKLNPAIFQQLQKEFVMNIDLFASRTNHQLPRYVSWRPDPHSVGVDALKMNWKDWKAYAFPPFCLIGKTLSKCFAEKAKLLLVAPLWRNQPWFPRLLEMLYSHPIKLPSVQDLIQDPLGEIHPLAQAGTLILVAWPVTGLPAERQNYQHELNSCSKTQFESRPTELTHQHLTRSYAGVLNGKLIPLRHLSTTY